MDERVIRLVENVTEVSQMQFTLLLSHYMQLMSIF